MCVSLPGDHRVTAVAMVQVKFGNVNVVFTERGNQQQQVAGSVSNNIHHVSIVSKV